MFEETDKYWLNLPFEQINEFFVDQLHDAKAAGEDNLRAMMRILGETDHYFLLTNILRRPDVAHPWLYERCREYQNEPKGCLDLWPREHYKSTIITFGGTFADIIADPESTTGIFSHTSPIAKAFLVQIKTEMEQNAQTLNWIWPEIFYTNPQRQSPKWSEDDGITVKRKNVQKEQTVEAWGLVDGQPTSKHFKHLRYDDVVTKESVGTPEQIKKTTDSWELSLSLGSQDGDRSYAGTRYHLFDTYSEILKRGVVKERLYACTKEGTEGGTPVFMSRELLKEKRKEQGPYTFAAQMLLNPVADKAMGFRQEWLVYASVTDRQAMTAMNRYIIVDPGGSKKRPKNDYTSMWVIGAGADKKFYWLDAIRDRLNLTERTEALFRLHRKWQPNGVGYEEYGMQADIEHIKFVMAHEVYRFEITPLGGQLAKNDRIKQLIPIFEQKRFIIPKVMPRLDHTGVMVDLVKTFIEEEYSSFPTLAHDDMFDTAARILEEDMMVTFPDPSNIVQAQGYDYHEIEQARQGIDWQIQ